MKVFYTYMWLREYDGTFPAGTPYYIGKGTCNRAYTNKAHTVRKPENSDCILVQDFPDEQSAIEGEKLLIAMYGRIDNGTGCLRNRTDGGDGTSGMIPWNKGKHSPGHPMSEAHKEKLRKLLSGKPLSVEHRLKLAKARTGKSLTEECRNKISQALKGKHCEPFTNEHRDNISKSRIGKKFSPWPAKRRENFEKKHPKVESIYKNHDYWKGKKFSESHKFKIRLATIITNCQRWNISRGKPCVCGKHIGEVND